MELPTRRPVVSFRRKVLRLVLQILIGGTLLASALGKTLDIPGFVEVLQAYQVFPNGWLWPFAFTLSGIEFFLGGWVLVGYGLPFSALIGGALITIYAVGVSITLLRGLTLSNCGCFGVFFTQPVTWLTPIEDLVFVGMCVALAYLAQTEQFPHHRLRTALLN